jgi:anti-sigma factor RsiW
MRREGSIVNCREIAELAPLYLSGEMDAPRAAAMDAHLQTCPACLEEMRLQAHFDARLREIVLSEELDEATVSRLVRERIAADSGVPARAGLLSRIPRRWVAAAIGAAAVLLLVGLGYRGLLGPRVARVYADAAQDHRREIIEQEPRRWLADPAQIAALAEQQGISGTAVLALAPDGYHLGRGRLCWLDGRIFLHLVYSNGAQEISLFLRQREAAPLLGPAGEEVYGKPLHTSGLGNEHVAAFETSRLTAVVVTDQSAEAALRFARLASAAL